jgi:hypothetical protein
MVVCQLKSLRTPGLDGYWDYRELKCAGYYQMSIQSSDQTELKLCI